jgi:hypothetical protein
VRGLSGNWLFYRDGAGSEIANKFFSEGSSQKIKPKYRYLSNLGLHGEEGIWRQKKYFSNN